MASSSIAGQLGPPSYSLVEPGERVRPVDLDVTPDVLVALEAEWRVRQEVNPERVDGHDSALGARRGTSFPTVRIG